MELIHQNGPLAKLARSKMTPQIIAVLGCLFFLPGAVCTVAPVSLLLLEGLLGLCQLGVTTLRILGF